MSTGRLKNDGTVGMVGAIMARGISVERSARKVTPKGGWFGDNHRLTDDRASG
jgi:hypothetical protein